MTNLFLLQVSEERLESVIKPEIPLVPVVSSGAGVEFAGEMTVFEQGSELAIGG